MAAPQHFSIVVLDMEASGSMSGPEKKEIREDLYAILHAALHRSGIPDEAVRSEDRGDGVFLLVAAAISKRRLFDPFLGALDEALRMRRVGASALRLRLVIHHGETILDDHGSSGPAVDLAFAMVDSAELRDALKEARGGRLAVVVPDDLYQSLVRGYPEPNPDAFRMRRLETKRGRIRTWVTVTGAAEQPGSGRRDADGRPGAVPGPVMTVEHRGDINTVEHNAGVVGGRHRGTINVGVDHQSCGDH
jgi:hypothetical protein